MTFPLPTYAQALLVPTVDEETADLLSRFPPSLLAGWPADAPQRQLVTSDAQALQFEKIQRAALAYAASPGQVLQLRAFLIAQGYSTTDAAAIASAWVDVVLEVYQTPRLPATKAEWSVTLRTPSPQTVSAQSQIVLQALDGTFFLSNATSPVNFTSGNSFTASVPFIARQVGTSGNVPAGSIQYLNQGPAGMTVYNPSASTQTSLVAARDAGTDEDSLAIATGRWGTLSGVLTDAGWAWVMQTPAVGGDPSLTAVYVDDTNPLGPGSVSITVGSAVGLPSAQALATAQAQGRKFTIAGVGPVVVGPVTVLQVDIAATLKTDGTNPLAAAQAASALGQMGGKVKDALILDAIIATLMGIPSVLNITSLALWNDNGGSPVSLPLADIPRPPGSSIVVNATSAPGGVTVV